MEIPELAKVLDGVQSLAEMAYESKKDLPGMVASIHQWWGRHRVSLEGPGLAAVAQVFDLDFWNDTIDRMETIEGDDGRAIWTLTPGDRFEVARLVEAARAALDQVELITVKNNQDGNTHDGIGSKLPLVKARRATVEDAQKALQQLVGVMGAQGVKDLPNENAVLAALQDRLGFKCSPKTLRATPMRRAWLKAQRQTRETFLGDVRKRLLVVADHDREDWEIGASAG